MSQEAIDRGHHEWLEGMKANDPAVLGRLVADDVVLMPPHIDPVAGRQAVVKWFAGVVQQARTTAVAVPQREVTIAGDLAIERGTFIWKVALPTGGSEVEDRGNFLAIWQKQPDGSWKVLRNIWNSTLPVSAIA